MITIIYIKENILIALEGIAANKVRSFLTMLGIIIGIGSVISIVTIGDALSDYVASQMARLGVTNILVALENKNTDDTGLTFLSGSLTENDLISDEMIEKYKENYQDSIKAISLSNAGGATQVREGRNYANISLLGVNNGYAVANDIRVLQGRFIQDSDAKAKRYVAVVSDKFVNNLFSSDEDCLGKEIKVDVSGSVQTFTIVGVYKYAPPMTFSVTAAVASEKDIRTQLFVPIETLNMLTAAEKGYLAITVTTQKDVDVLNFSWRTREFFNTYYTHNTKFEVTAVSMEAMVSIVGDVLNTLSLGVAVIGGISLVVGGIGIMNIMLVSVTERTREIGMRKALGARNLSIQIQFIVEAAIIASIGGIIGTLFGTALGYGGSVFLDYPKLPGIEVIIVSVLFSMMIGVFFGFYPANKAANLEPVEALRYE
ncbi:MAG: ABC transporter permease [Clostridiales bacterium]|nr:ABC transporter permease [Clostridiales bacterium]